MTDRWTTLGVFEQIRIIQPGTEADPIEYDFGDLTQPIIPGVTLGSNPGAASSVVSPAGPASGIAPMASNGRASGAGSVPPPIVNARVSEAGAMYSPSQIPPVLASSSLPMTQSENSQFTSAGAGSGVGGIRQDQMPTVATSAHQPVMPRSGK